MPYEQSRFYRFAIIANPVFGSASFSWRVKCALENLGHTVFWFDSARHPFLFRGKTIDASLLEAFIGRQKPDFLLITDDVELDETQIVQLKGYCENMTIERLSQKGCSSAGIGCDDAQNRPFFLDTHVDEGYLGTPLANTIAHPAHVLCLQNATPTRIETLRTAEASLGEKALPIRCMGAGWPEEWAANIREWHSFVYLSRSCAAAFVFDDEAEDADEHLLELLQVDGVPIVHTAKDLLAAVGEPSLEARRFSQGEAFKPTLEEELANILASFPGATMPESTAVTAAGSMQPRIIVTILGYFGMGNFGDEYILATLDERIRNEVAGSSVIAVSECPEHTLVKRGIYATSLEDIHTVDRTLAYSSCAVVVAGLLFDQGIRWCTGKADAFTSTRCSDIPGITAFASLAAANDTPTVFHGIGAGPLEVLDGRQLVRLMGRQGALFTPRDAETGNLIRSCGVPADQIIDCADTIFLHANTSAGVKGSESAADQNSAAHGHGASATSPLIAVSLRDYENTPNDFAQRMALAFDEVLGKHDDFRMGFCLLDPSDRALSENVIAQMRLNERCDIVDHEGNLDKLVEYLASAQAGFSMRYHSALVMSTHGVPCVGMDYLPKVASLYRDLGIYDLLVSPNATSDQAETALLSAIENAAEWQEGIRTHIAPLAQKSRQAFDILLEQIQKTRNEKARAVPMEFFLETVPASKRNIQGLEAYGAMLREHQAKLEAIIHELDLQVETLRNENTALRERLAAEEGKASSSRGKLRSLFGR